MGTHTTPATKRVKSSRIPVTKPGEKPGFIEPTSRRLYTSRTRRGPLLAPSEKSEGMLGCESALEGLFVAATRFDPRVQRTLPQPLVMDVVTGITAPDREQLMKRLRAEGYAPSDAKLWFVDFELVIVGRLKRVYVEVKPAERADKVGESMEERRRTCERIGVDFMLACDTDFPEPLRTNIRIMQRYAGMPISPDTKARALGSLRGGPRTLSDLAAATASGLAELYGLVSNGDLGMDLRAERLSPRSSVHASSPSLRVLLNLPE